MEKLRHVNARRVLDKLAVPSEPGLTNAQLMLTNHDLKPGEHKAMWKEIEERKNQLIRIVSGTGTPPMGSLEFCGVLDCRFIQHRTF